ncbi:DUF4352 domain-containing protein [Listeria kieliensis]|uniref:DUF4352 domain-containing protein n=1 Tax=Listeria kieliensis TaxID=1621700 RepID=A0A3D8TV68_9LIST|nr:DUF4352 domain-containing protein [Listeria kieliensis]RDX02689.1 hypothetical protein UR08_04055 [Listeria kieliensis]
MLLWIILGGILAFILFVIGLIILFFPKQRKVGAILVGAGMVLMIAAIVGVFLHFKQLDDVNNEVLNYSAGKSTSESGKKEAKTYQVNHKVNENNIELTVKTVKVEKKPVYSTMEQKEMPGSISLVLAVKNNGKEKLTTYPNQGTLQASKMEVDGGDVLLSEFDASTVEPGKTIEGTLVFPLEKLKSVASVHSVSLSWLSYFGSESDPVGTETGTIKLTK